MNVKLKVVYDGLLHNEGHEVNFEVDSSQDSVLITESFNANELTPTRIGLDSAIEKQKKLIALGYEWL